MERQTKVSRGRLLWRLLLCAVLLALSAGCEFKETPSGGYWIIPDHPDGRRLLIIGDSLIRQPSLSVGFSLMPGNLETRIEAVNTSGLVSGPVNWELRAAELVAEFRPTHVLMGITGNFTPPYWPPYAPSAAPGTPEYDGWVAQQKGSEEFLARHVAAAKAITGIFSRAGAEVYWVEPPPFPPAYGNPPLPDRIWRRFEAELPGTDPNLRFISARSSIATLFDGWLEYKVICGVRYQIRSTQWDGGVHFTADGAGTYGRALARALAAAEGWPAPPRHCPGLPD